MGFTFNSVDLGTYGLTVLHGSDDQALPEGRVDLIETGGEYGGVAQGVTYAPRRWTLECLVKGTTRDEFRGFLDTVMYTLRPTQGDKLYVAQGMSLLTAALRRGRYCRVVGAIDLKVLSGLAARLSVGFVAADPLEYALSATTQNVTVDQSPESFNVAAAAVVAGTAVAVPVWTITNTDAATVGVVTLNNVTRGESLQWTGALAQNAKLRVDSQRCYIERSTDGGTNWTGVMSGLRLGDPFPGLTPGVQNSCTLVGLAAGTLGVSYYARWL